MTLKHVQDAVDAYMAEHKYQLAEDRIELGHGLINDSVVIRAKSFPGVATAGPDAVAETYVLSQLHNISMVRDKGLPAFIGERLDRMIGAIIGGREGVQQAAEEDGPGADLEARADSKGAARRQERVSNPRPQSAGTSPATEG